MIPLGNLPVEQVAEHRGSRPAARRMGSRAARDPFALAQRIDQALAGICRLAKHRVRASAPRVDPARLVDAQNARTSLFAKPHSTRFPTAPTRLVFISAFGNLSFGAMKTCSVTVTYMARQA